MIKLLSRIFIKNNGEYENPKVRGAYGILCGAVGIFLNILLFAGKFIAGTISKSVAVTADAFNNLADAGSSIITMFGFKLAGQKPDPEHPFGHGRFEYISGLLVSIAIILMGIELLKSSVDKIIHPEMTEFSYLTVGILAASILVKLYMSFYNKNIGKKIDSAALKATGTDSLSDTISTVVVLISVIVSHYFKIAIDGYCGLAVAAFVLYSGIKSAKETITPLLGIPPDPEFVKQVEETVLKYEGVTGIHDMIVHDYGPGRLMVSLHAEMATDENSDIFKMHDIIDNIEKDIKENLNCEITIHLDPVAANDERTNRLKEEVTTILNGLDKVLTLHDFRIVPGETHTNLIFDIVIPFKYRMSDNEISEYMKKAIHEMDDGQYFAVINIDHAYVKPPQKA